jgi:sugar/nucleoside kinase (ribokinase family)
VPGYSLVISPLREAALGAASIAPSVSVDLSSTAAVHAVGIEAFRETVVALAPRVIFANEEEAALVGELEAETVVVKRGAAGCVVRRGLEEISYAATAAEAVDSTGAGDALAAGFLLGGPELGLAAAARCVAQMGAMP